MPDATRMNHARAPNNPSAATNEKQAGASPSLQEHHPYAVTPLRRSSRQRRRVDRLLCCDHEGEAGNDKPDLDWIVDDDDGDEYDDRCEDDHELEEDHCSKIEHNLNRDKSTLAQCNGELRLPRGKRDKSRSLAGLAVRFSEYIRVSRLLFLACRKDPSQQIFFLLGHSCCRRQRTRPCALPKPRRISRSNVGGCTMSSTSSKGLSLYTN